MLVLAQFAFAEYSRSAATSVTCHSCSGTGFTSLYEDVVKHPCIINSEGVEAVPAKVKRELVKHICDACNGKGVIYARCRCGGKGEVLDRKATKEHGAPVFKNVSGVMVMVILRYPQLLHTGRFLSASRICMSEHGPATGSHFWSYWWILPSTGTEG